MIHLRDEPGKRWLDMSTCPFDRNFEIQDCNGDVYLAHPTSGGGFHVDADWPVTPTHWRPIEPREK